MRICFLTQVLLAGTLVFVGCDAGGLAPPETEVQGVRFDVDGDDDDDDDDDELCILVKSLVGTWEVTSFRVDGGPNLIEPDLLFVVIFFSDGTTSEFISGDTNHSFCDAPETSCNDEGSRYIQTDVNLLICDPHCDEILDYTLSGNTLNISFDGGHEDGHPPSTATAVRTG